MDTYLLAWLSTGCHRVWTSKGPATQMRHGSELSSMESPACGCRLGVRLVMLTWLAVMLLSGTRLDLVFNLYYACRFFSEHSKITKHFSRVRIGTLLSQNYKQLTPGSCKWVGGLEPFGLLKGSPGEGISLRFLFVFPVERLKNASCRNGLKCWHRLKFRRCRRRNLKPHENNNNTDKAGTARS